VLTSSKGARVYFYHQILHDWPDNKCLEMLECVKQAMTPGYSRLLIHEVIVPKMHASSYIAALDMTTMCLNGGMERTERQWRALVQQAGLEVVEVWYPPEDDANGIVEVMARG
jgi:hypothetical protein